MRALCRLFKHRAPTTMVWNDGQHFGRCGRCGRDLIRTDGIWRSVPPGYRIVWKDRTPKDIEWSRWNASASPSTQGPSARGRAAAPAPELKTVGAAVERRDPASPGRADDRRRPPEI